MERIVVRCDAVATRPSGPSSRILERQVDRLTVGVKKTLGVGVKQVWQSLEGEVAVGLVHSPESGLALVGSSKSERTMRPPPSVWPRQTASQQGVPAMFASRRAMPKLFPGRRAAATTGSLSRISAAAHTSFCARTSTRCLPSPRPRTKDRRRRWPPIRSTSTSSTRRGLRAATRPSRGTSTRSGSRSGGCR